MNPELRRNLWLEFSVHRCIAMPGVLALAFLCAALGTHPESDAGVATTGLLLFVGLAGIWGARRTADAVTEEWRSRTWDGQRMSALGPWSMTWGKLAGSTAFAWYGALMCLAVVAAVWPLHWRSPAGLVLASAVCAAIGVQALGLIASLMATRKGHVRAYTNGIAVVLLFLLVSGPGAVIARAVAQDLFWWGHQIDTLYFACGSAAVFAAWTVFGAYRLMCQELQVRTTPWAWALFVLFLAWYLAGFVTPTRDHDVRIIFYSAGLLVPAVLTYLLLFTEQTSALAMQRAWLRLQRREWQRALEEIPCWLVSLAIAAVFCLMLLLTLGERTSLLWAPADTRVILLPLVVLLHLLRDTAIFLIFSLGRAPRRVETTTLLYFVLLYLLLPWVCKAAGADRLGALVLPLMFKASAVAPAILAVHVAIALGLVVHRWRQSFKT